LTAKGGKRRGRKWGKGGKEMEGREGGEREREGKGRHDPVSRFCIMDYVKTDSRFPRRPFPSSLSEIT